MKLVVKEEVYGDLMAIVKWYEDQSASLGKKFLNEWEETLNDVANQPNSFQVKYKKFRQAKIRQFPYLIVFEVEQAEVIVYAVIHGHRNPRKRFLRK